MNVKCVSFALAIAGACLAGPISAQITIDVTPALAPNLFGSASGPTWISNSIFAQQNGLTAFGTAGTPGYYEAAPAVLNVWDNYVTSFPSWHGDADPGTTFGAAFANEGGNRLHFGVVINGNGQTFSISQLSFVGTSGDPGNTLGFSFAEGVYQYSSDYVGIQFGLDGALGGVDDVLITGGLNTQLVDMLVGRGSGNAWWPGGPGDTAVGTNQEIIDATTNYFLTEVALPFDFTGTYSLGTETGSGSVSFIPEPSTYAAMLGLGVLAVVAIRRRRPRLID